MRASRSPSSRSRLADLLRPVAAGAALILAIGARAQAPDPDEVVNLRLAKDAGSVVLTWEPPATTPDSYQVRRCILPSLLVPYYGNCIAEGLTATTHADPMPPADVFYLVSGSFGGVEGSLGRSFDGLLWRPRTAPDCSSPVTPGSMTLRVRLFDDVVVCGTDVTVRHPTDGITFVSASCTDVTSGFFPITNPTEPGIVRHACASATGSTGPGRITELVFDHGDCPFSALSFDVQRCTITVGMPDCGNPVSVDMPCTIQ